MIKLSKFLEEFIVKLELNINNLLYLLIKTEDINDGEPLNKELESFFLEMFDKISFLSENKYNFSEKEQKLLVEIILMLFEDIENKDIEHILSRIINSDVFFNLVENKMLNVNSAILYKIINKHLNEDYKIKFYSVFIKSDDIPYWIKSVDDLSFISNNFKNSNFIISSFFALIKSFKDKLNLYNFDTKIIKTFKSDIERYNLLSFFLELFDVVYLSFSDLCYLLMSPHSKNYDELYELIFQKIDKQFVLDGYKTLIENNKGKEQNTLFINLEDYNISYRDLFQIRKRFNYYFKKIDLNVDIDKEEFLKFNFYDLDIKTQLLIINLANNNQIEKRQFNIFTDFIKEHDLYDFRDNFVFVDESHHTLLKMNYKI